jgi:hypothetical protein
MKNRSHFYAILLLSLTVLTAQAQQSGTKSGNPSAMGSGKPVMWEPVDPSTLDLYAGPGGESMRPDLSRIEFIEEETGGHNKKYRVKDGSGRTWVAKLGIEAKPETVAVRLLYGLGYKTEINYFVPKVTIPGKGTFEDVRFEARPDNVKRLDEWKWKENPFVGTKELQGLKMMMVFMNNWDVLDLQNKVLQVGDQQHYIVSDLGRTFGRLGNNNFPLVYRLGRRTGSPGHYTETDFVEKVDDGEVKLAYKGKNRGLFEGFTVEDANWLADRFQNLTDKKIADAFRAANYTPEEIDIYVEAVRRRISELQSAAAHNNNLATGN